MTSERLNPEVVESYVLAWTCLKIICVAQDSSIRQLPKPEPETWKAIAFLHNQKRQSQLRQPTQAATAENIEKWMLICAKAARSFLFPDVISINKPKPGYESGEIVDSIVGEVDDSLLSDMIAKKEIQQRGQQQTDINQFLIDAVAQLKPESQKLLKLYYSQGLKQADIAQELKTQQYTISRQLSKARKVTKALSQRTQEKLHISLTSDILDNISSLLEEWLASY
ncbi:sigma-70 family RNA polymerase sigma factor [Pleurocapsa sp. FMAR1]|uniref:sigma-70 family RNA polymerase sigma factor n=1 Tax=Pleurocapsa sp. FMAR1 TaxID=3040204 RepID=UPI0029C7028F|nr:sigma-70 family RNA polymerase sigma factor [Pleurocapsa sp. FMAR1]